MPEGKQHLGKEGRVDKLDKMKGYINHGTQVSTERFEKDHIIPLSQIKQTLLLNNNDQGLLCIC